MQLLKLVVEQLRADAPLPWNVRDAQGHLLLAKGRRIAGEAQRDALLERGVWVDAEEFRAAGAVAAPAAPGGEAPPTVFALWERSVAPLGEALAALGAPGSAARLDAIADGLVALVDRDPDVALYRCVRQDAARLADYGLTHAQHAATVGLLTARGLGWDAARTRRLVKAALTMNLTIVALQGRLARQETPPGESQRALLRPHPIEAAARLRAAGVGDEAWLAIVEQHHERPDGSGYPRGASDLLPDAVLLRHADVFMAKISPRATRPPLPTQLAARQLFAEDRGGPLAGALIKAFGIYPPGDLVRLAGGERAVVIRRGANAATPLVAAITDRRGAPVLETVRRDTADPAFAIAGTVDDKRLVLRLPPERLYGLV